MGKGGRICCIFTPFALTVATFICLIIIQISGWSKGLLPSYYFFKLDLTNLDVSSATDQLADLANIDTSALSTVLQQVVDQAGAVWEIHLWNYCTAGADGTIDYCSKREAQFAFDPLEVWSLNSTATTGAIQSAIPSIPSNSAIPSAVQSAVATVTDNVNLDALSQNVLGDGVSDALDAYKKASHIMFILYAVAFWTTLATIVMSLFAICSRWGSLCTWIFSSVSSIVTLCAVGLTTGIFVTLVGALRGVLDPYNVEVDLGRKVLAVGWLAVIFSWAATLFWLFSICCCSGRSNPHHRSNKGGLWNAEPKGMGYTRRSLDAEKPAGGYQRVSDPFLTHSRNNSGDNVPLTPYPPQQTTYANPYEPYRHNY